MKIVTQGSKPNILIGNDAPETLEDLTIKVQEIQEKIEILQTQSTPVEG